MFLFISKNLEAVFLEFFFIFLTVLLLNKNSLASISCNQYTEKIAKEYNIKVYTIGAGTNQSITQIPGRGFVRNEIDEETLKGIAEVTNAKYFRATDKKSLSEIYSEIDNLEKSEITVSYFSSYQEIYIWFLIIGFFFLIISEILRAYYFRKVI